MDGKEQDYRSRAQLDRERVAVSGTPSGDEVRVLAQRRFDYTVDRIRALEEQRADGLKEQEALIEENRRLDTCFGFGPQPPTGGLKR